MKDINIYREERPWGEFCQFTQNVQSTVKLIKVKPNEAFSLQSHDKRSEFWRILSGSGKIQIGDQIFEGKAGDDYEVPINTKHRVSAGKDGITFLEIAVGDFDESDIIRYEDKYGRA